VKKKGLTLFEMVTIIVVMGLAIPVLLNMWADVGRRSGRSEAMAEATFYAQELMEEIKSKKFDENDAAPWSTTLNHESGETYPNFDDVDDFNDYPDPLASGYTRSCIVDYVELTGSTWGAATSPPTDFKRITVTVSRTDNLSGNVSLVTIVAGY
jgi:type II secretory pathway pseudopilin PulG